MKTTEQTKREARQLFRSCLLEGRVDESRVRQVVARVLQTQRRGYRGLLHYFQRLLKLDYARHTAAIDSAMPLPADLRARIEVELERTYGPGLSTRFAINPALIGGMRIKVGSDVYDGSVQFRLAVLEKNF